MRLGTIFSPLNQRVQRLGQHGFHLRIHRIFRVLTRQRYAQRIFRTVCQQAVQIERTARFRPGAGETFTAERLHAHDRANHVAVDVQVADFSIAGHLGNGFVDTGMHAKRQAVTRGVDLIDQLVEVVTVVAHHVQYRTEDLFFQARRSLPGSISVGGTKVPVCHSRASSLFSRTAWNTGRPLARMV